MRYGKICAVNCTIAPSNPCVGCVVQWFMNHMAEDDWWPIQILIKCPNQVVRQVSHSLLSATRLLSHRAHAITNGQNALFEGCVGRGSLGHPLDVRVFRYFTLLISVPVFSKWFLN